MTQTYYLKATSEANLWTALEAAGLAHKQYDPTDALNSRPDDLEPDAEWEPTGAYEWIADTPMLDIIGTMYAATGNMLTTEDGMEYPEMAPIDGFHANLREELTDEQVALLPTVDAPATPYRKWAGDE